MDKTFSESYKKRVVNQDRFSSILTSYKSYLDVGCGSGAYLTSNGYSIVEGCDIEDLRVGDARNVEFKIQKLPELQYKDSQFDVVSAFEVLEHVQDYQKSIAELTRIVRKKLVISVPNCDVNKCCKHNGLIFSHYEDRTHVNFFNKESIASTVKENTCKEIKDIKVSLINHASPLSAALSCYFGFNHSINRIFRYLETRIFKKKTPKITLLVEVLF